jgi:hypothetical protein
MKSVIVLALALCSTAAFARPNTTALSCADAQDLVAREGSIVLNTGAPGLFQRFVAGARFCGNSEAAAPAYVTTADAASCKIGFYCGNSSSDDKLVAKKFASNYTKCVAGARKLDTEYNSNDKAKLVAKVCTANGKWVNADGSVAPKAAKVVCQEGKIQPVTYQDAFNSDRQVQGAAQCRAGKWIRIR